MPDALIKSNLITYRRETPPVPQLRGQVMNFTFIHTFAATFDYDNVDKLIFGILPAFCVPVDAILQGVTMTNVCDVGLVGSARALDDIVAGDTVGDELFDGVTVAVAGTRTVNWTDILAITPTPYDRGIGLIATAADITSGHGIKLNLSYKLGPHTY